MGLFACSTNTKNKTIEKASIDSSQTAMLTTQQIFPENSIGVAYLDTIKGDNYVFTIRFPFFFLPDSILPRDTSNYIKELPINIPSQTIILFDEAGELITLKNVSECTSKFWCENDGGIQYEPTYNLTIESKNFIRKPSIKDFKVLGKISCFALINYNKYQLNTFYPDNSNESENIVMRGRLSADYSGYNEKLKGQSLYKMYDRNVQISAEKDEAGMADYCILLEVFNNRRYSELGCCGP
jgi:hypothetical protein